MYFKRSEEDKNKIQSWINFYGISQGAYRYSVLSELKYILRFWKEHKNEYLFKAFGEQLILEKEVEYYTPDQDIQDKMAASISYGKMNTFYTKIRTFAD